MATLDVSESPYNAAADGQTDDSGAIQQAIDDAAAGDIVYLPGTHNTGTYLVQPDGDPGAAIRLKASQLADNITIEGDLGDSLGEAGNTRVQMGDVNDDFFHYVFRPNPDGVLNFTLREMEIDGQNDINISDSNARPAYCINEETPGTATGHSHVYEQLYLVDAAGNGISSEVECTIRDCTAENCDVQGFGMQTAGGGTTTVKRSKALNCGNNNAGTGFDFGTGNYDAEDLFGENNLFGNKINSRTGDVTLTNATFRGGPNQQAAGFRWNEGDTQTDSTTTIDRIACRDCGDSPAMRIDGNAGDTWDIGRIETTNSDADGDQGGVFGRGDMTATADEIATKDNGGSGVQWAADGTLDVTDLYCANNGGGCTGGFKVANLTVGNQQNQRVTLTTPSAGDVGAFNADTGGGSGGGGTISPGNIFSSTAAGVLETTSGAALETISVGASIVDDFEAYTPDTVLEAQADEWGSVSTFSSMSILESFLNSGNTGFTTEGARTSGRDSGSGTGFSAAQSNPEPADVTNQSAAFDSYPRADCTIRAGVFVDNADVDVAFAVPAGEANFNQNCYRVRAGDSTNPFLRRTVAGSSTSLASFGSSLTAETWYDFAIEFEATGSAVNLSLQVYEYDAGTSQWTDFGSISGTDSANNFPDAQGIAIAANLSGAGSGFVDYYRFFNALGETQSPSWSPS